MVLGIGISIWGLIAVKFWDKFTFEPDFTEDMDDEDIILAAWAKAYMKREDRRIGIYHVYVWDTNKNWHTVWYFQFMKYFKVQILKYKTPKRNQLF